MKKLLLPLLLATVAILPATSSAYVLFDFSNSTPKLPALWTANFEGGSYRLKLKDSIDSFSEIKNNEYFNKAVPYFANNGYNNFNDKTYKFELSVTDNAEKKAHIVPMIYYVADNNTQNIEINLPVGQSTYLNEKVNHSQDQYGDDIEFQNGDKLIMAPCSGSNYGLQTNNPMCTTIGSKAVFFYFQANTNKTQEQYHGDL